MTKMLQMYGAFIAGVLALAGLAYLFYVKNYLEDDDGNESE